MGFWNRSDTVVAMVETAADCTRLNELGVNYREFSCVMGWQPYYFDFETRYDPVPVLHWMQSNAWFPVLACCLYVALIVAGRRYFASRDRLQWRIPLAVWNLALSSFSFYGLVRTAPQLAYNLQTLPGRDHFCADPQTTYGSGSTGLWVQLFILSKFPELIDTLFIVVHKKPLLFLHWYHHVTVLLYCWHSYVTTSPPGLFFCVMNYGVHAVMYFYYFLMAARCKPRWFRPVYITVAQISQMVVGVAVTLVGFYYYRLALHDHVPCHLTTENNTAAFVMYGSYLFLFAQFFVGRYVTAKVSLGTAKATPAGSSSSSSAAKKNV